MLRHVSGVHGSHPSAHELGLLQAVLDLLLSELVFDIETEWHGAFVLLAVFGMVAAKSYELFAHRTATVGLALAALGVLDNPFHLLAGWQRAVCVAALAGVDEGLDAALDAQPSRLLGALGLLLSLVVALIVQTQAPLNHLVVVALSVVAVDAEVVVLADRAVPPGLHVVLALVAGVDEAVLALRVQLHQHAQRGPLGAAQGGELPVLVPGQGEEGVPPVHQVTAQQRIRVHNGVQGVDHRPRM